MLRAQPGLLLLMERRVFSPSGTRLGTGPGSVHVHNLFEGHLERELDGRKHGIPLEPNIGLGDICPGETTQWKEKAMRGAACCHIVYNCEKLGARG